MTKITVSRALAGVALVFLGACPLLAQPPAPPPPTPPPTGQTTGETKVEELERRLRELAARVLELEAGADRPPEEPKETAPPEDTGSASQAPPPATPAQTSDEASTVSQTGPISGYMDFHLNRPEHEDPVLDFHRFVLLFNHSFTDRLRFIGELELEHAVI